MQSNRQARGYQGIDPDPQAERGPEQAPAVTRNATVWSIIGPLPLAGSQHARQPHYKRFARRL